eukprot:Skav215298  [mRNA]  locus=scaffold6542:42008:42307:- [translate_table: standard]
MSYRGAKSSQSKVEEDGAHAYRIISQLDLGVTLAEGIIMSGSSLRMPSPAERRQHARTRIRIPFGMLLRNVWRIHSTGIKPLDDEVLLSHGTRRVPLPD